eukprot:TRINITY_DN498_c1_g1_i1.p1 TRINITY_DN498_c1_g1~~TRINITY_DN498_c1_g1_i1.p1  ORF type:complete len:147 (+),score=68.73 TRINITY_DN498_c1_g1_i1:85-525(+)
MENGQTDQLLKKVFIDSGSQDEAQRVLRGAKKQYREMMQLEREINELHLTFLQIATIVEEQSEKLEHIEQKVDDVQMKTGIAVEKIKEARKAKRKRLKTKFPFCCYVADTRGVDVVVGIDGVISVDGVIGVDGVVGVRGVVVGAIS